MNQDIESSHSEMSSNDVDCSGLVCQYPLKWVTTISFSCIKECDHMPALDSTLIVVQIKQDIKRFRREHTMQPFVRRP